MVAPKWGGGLGGPLSYEGFRYDDYEDNGEKLRRIVYGDVGAKVLAGMHKAVRVIAESGNNVIVDEMLLDKTILKDWVKEIGHFYDNNIANYDILTDSSAKSSSQCAEEIAVYDFNKHENYAIKEIKKGMK